MLVVLDTNVVVSGAMWRGNPATILNAWADRLFEAVASPEILDEYEEILLEVGHKVGRKDFAERWILTIKERIHVVLPERKVKLCRDPDDDKFLSCALAADAVFLVSGDKDLGVLERIGSTLIVTPGQFVREHLKKVKENP
ncbi:MAG TPA: putative toxin-antitoxin system toxin component, PIN family [Fibrobacteria bacterium]|nr:putative toxin-antitoxin system toxin component, PIN family [Fibrobacteria bacterium]